MRAGLQAFVALTGPLTLCKGVAVLIEWCTLSKLGLFIQGQHLSGQTCHKW